MKKILIRLANIANRCDERNQGALGDRIDHVMYALAEIEYDTDTERKELELARIDKSDIKHQADKNLLLKHDLIPIEEVDEKGFLGRGLYGTVYRASLNGKEVAAKVSDLNSGDVANWIRILRASEQLSATAKQHLPIIYDIIVDKELYKSIVVMEMLQPMDKGMKNFISQYSTTDIRDTKGQGLPEDIKPTPTTFGRLLADSETFYSILEDAWNSAMVKAEDDETFPVMPSDQQKRDFLNWAIKWEGDKVDSFIRAAEGWLLANNVVGFTDPIINPIENKILSYLGLDIFPRKIENWQEFDQGGGLKYRPEVAGLFQAVMELAGEDIMWNDLHEHNIMQRPSTGDLVIVDVGLFT